jgi:hypothetical protein
MIAELAEAHQRRPIFASILPVSDYHKMQPAFRHDALRPPATILALNNWLRQFCAQHGYVYVDYSSVIVDSPAASGRPATTVCTPTAKVTA